jgi:hypothetical protein
MDSDLREIERDFFFCSVFEFQFFFCWGLKDSFVFFWFLLETEVYSFLSKCVIEREIFLLVQFLIHPDNHLFRLPVPFDTYASNGQDPHHAGL